MSEYHNELYEGCRVYLKSMGAGTIMSRDYDYDNYRYNGIKFTYIVKFDKDGQTVTYDTDSATTSLYEGLIYAPNRGFEIGDTMEIARAGLEPNLRGRLLEIDEKAEMWPYRVGQEGVHSVWFSYRELTKIHSVISRERAPRAKEALKEQIARTRAELEALETALEVLEYAS